MITHPIIDAIAALDMTLLRGVRKADQQKVQGQTACFCPFCRRERVGVDGAVELQNHDGSETPHFIIYDTDFGGLYGNDNGKGRPRGVRRWRCTRTGRTGYGAIELYAAIHNIPLFGAGLFRACRNIVMEIFVGKTDKQIAALPPDEQRQLMQPVADRYPQLFGGRGWRAPLDYRITSERTQSTFTFQPKTDFTPQELHSLGCDVLMQGGVITYGWSSGGVGGSLGSEQDFSPADINHDFNVYSLTECTLPRVLRDGNEVSETIVGTPWNPLFVCFKDDSMLTGCVFRPAQPDALPIVFSQTDDHTVAKVSKWLMGDNVFNYAMEHRDSASTSVHAAMKQYDKEELETVTKERQEWEQQQDERTGDWTDKWALRYIPLKDTEIKARHIVFCETPQDAISTFYAMRAYRHRCSYNEDIARLCWYHVAFTLGRGQFWRLDRGQWEKSAVDFGNVQYNKLSRFAESVIVLYSRRPDSRLQACNIARKYPRVLLSLLPARMDHPLFRRYTSIFGREMSSVRDFLIGYKMDPAESFDHDGDHREILYNCLTSALSACPLERKEKRDRNNAVKEIYYTVNSATVWTFMMCEGYYRTIDEMSDDKNGRFVHIEGPWVTNIRKDSMVAEVQRRLKMYAARNNKGNEDYALMEQGIERDNREVNDRTIMSLPLIELDYRGAYGEGHDHFFYQNGALRITRDEIRLIPYSECNFHIDRRAILPWNFTMPTSSPFAISENPEYAARRAEIDNKKNELDDCGNPKYTTDDILVEESKLMEWSMTHRWKVDWLGRSERQMWPCLRVIRGFANIDWRAEDELHRKGDNFSEEQQSLLDAHFANIIFALARTLHLFHGNQALSAPYLLENAVEDVKSASGGSGKSSLINIFAACGGKVLPKSAKDFHNVADLKFALSDFIPHVHRAVHWEDWPSGLPLTALYNFVTAGVSYEKKFTDRETLGIDEAPNMVITSNYSPSDTQDSTMRRYVMVPFSDRFTGENVMDLKAGRSPSALMPSFRSDNAEYLPERDRNQIAYICALAVQFLIRYATKVQAPVEDLKERVLDKEITPAARAYFSDFFSHAEVYGQPIDLKSCFEDFRRNYTEASEDKMAKYALGEFRRRCKAYCKKMGVTMNPEHLFETKASKRLGYFTLSAWVTHSYFCDARWERDPDTQPKHVRVWGSSQTVCYFYRAGDPIPKNYDQLKKENRVLGNLPDPMPYRDSDGNIVVITEEEKALSKAGPSRTAPFPPAQPSTQTQLENFAQQEPDLPF